MTLPAGDTPTPPKETDPEEGEDVKVSTDTLTPVSETVTDETSPKGDAGDQLAHTGASSSASALAAAGGLLALGGGAVLYTRRRQNS